MTGCSCATEPWSLFDITLHRPHQTVQVAVEEIFFLSLLYLPPTHEPVSAGRHRSVCDPGQAANSKMGSAANSSSSWLSARSAPALAPPLSYWPGFQQAMQGGLW